MTVGEVGLGIPRLRGAEAPGAGSACPRVAAAADSLREPGDVWGSVHSWDLVTGADGPGTRMTVFLAGCPLRCQYCQNPDTWRMRDGASRTVADVAARVERYAEIMRVTGGGLTVSGGEPLLQHRFVTSLFRRAKEIGVHTALDTSGFLGTRLTDEDLADVDLVLLDLKSGLPHTYREVTGRPLQPTLDFAERLSRLGRRTWIRFVLVPGLTDAPENVAAAADIVAGLRGVERVEILPFHQMGRAKWEATGQSYRLAHTPTPTAEQVEAARAIFRARGVAVY